MNLFTLYLLIGLFYGLYVIYISKDKIIEEIMKRDDVKNMSEIEFNVAMFVAALIVIFVLGIIWPMAVYKDFSKSK